MATLPKKCGDCNPAWLMEHDGTVNQKHCASLRLRMSSYLPQTKMLAHLFLLAWRAHFMLMRASIKHGQSGIPHVIDELINYLWELFLEVLRYPIWWYIPVLSRLSQQWLVYPWKVQFVIPPFVVKILISHGQPSKP